MTSDEDAAALDRHGAPWTEQDHLEFVTCVRQGVADADIAGVLGRSPGALRSRARMMLPSGHSGRRPVDALREFLDEDPGYDWRSMVRATAAAQGWHFWTRAEEQILAYGWVEATSMRQLGDQLGLPETIIARQLVQVGLAVDTIEVTTRLGCAPGGVLALRRSLALDRQASIVWCLVVIGHSRRDHLSIHPSRAAAEENRDRLLAAVDHSADQSPCSWIAERSPGSGIAGETYSG